MALVLNSIFFSLYEIHPHFSFLHADYSWRQSGAPLLSQPLTSCSLTALIKRLVKITRLFWDWGLHVRTLLVGSWYRLHFLGSSNNQTQKSYTHSTIVNVTDKMGINMGGVDPAGCQRVGALRAFVRWIKWSLRNAAAACFRTAVFFVNDGTGL